MTNNDMQIPNPMSLALELLNTEPSQRISWLSEHRDALTIEVVQALKAISDENLRSDPKYSRDACHCAFLVAQFINDHPALLLACWAWANGLHYNEPKQSVEWAERALEGYRSLEPYNAISVARILANLVASRMECGLFEDAHAAYNEAYPIQNAAYQQAKTVFEEFGESKREEYDTPLYRLLVLEQNYRSLLYTERRYQEALLVDLRIMELAKQVGPINVAEAKVNLALTLIALGQPQTGEALLLEALPVAEEYKERLTVARIRMNLGELYAELGRPAEALQELWLAKQDFIELENAMEQESVLIREARLLERVGALRTASKIYRQVREQFEVKAMFPQVGVALLQEASAHRRLGNYDKASKLIDRAVHLWNRDATKTSWSRDIALERIELTLSQGQISKARSLLRQFSTNDESLFTQIYSQLLSAEVMLVKNGENADKYIETKEAFERVANFAQTQKVRWMAYRALLGLGKLMLPTDPDIARSYFEQATAVNDEIRQTLSVEEMRATFEAQSNEALSALARLAFSQEKFLDLLSYAWRAKGSSLLEMFYEHRTKHNLPLDEDIKRIRYELASKRYPISDDPDAGRTELDLDVALLEGRILELRRLRNQAISTNIISKLNNPVELLAQMDADILIEYMLCGESILVVIADQAGVRQAHRIDSANDVQKTVQKLHRLLDEGEHYISAPSRIVPAQQFVEVQRLLKQCYDILIAPLNSLPDTGRLLIAPCHPLHILPFGALWDGQHYLIEQYEIETILSGALLATPRASAMASSKPVIIADSAGGDLESFRAQVDAIGALLTERVLFNDEPGALTYLDRLTLAPQILHIAAHAHMYKQGDGGDELPIFSSLHLNQEVLTVEHCYNLKLDGTELVCLIGCKTVEGTDTGGALLNFPAACFTAGALRVILTIRQIHHQSATACMQHFYGFLTSGYNPSLALRRAQLELLRDPKYNHPAIWGAFVYSRR